MSNDSSFWRRHGWTGNIYIWHSGQKDRFLPDILEFNTWWCQGYSEPGSGSDLASLKTKAVLEGDHYVVNGSKTWTTLAQMQTGFSVLLEQKLRKKNKKEYHFY